jgi:hypothetical protein
MARRYEKTFPIVAKKKINKTKKSYQLRAAFINNKKTVRRKM